MLPIGGTVSGIANHDVAVALSDPIIEKAPTICLEVEESLPDHPTYEHPSVWVDPTASQPWVAAIRRVINISFRSSDGEIKAAGNNSSVLRINRRIDGRIKIAGTEFTNDRSTVALIMKNGNIVICDNVALNRPMLLAGKVNGIVDSRWIVVRINIGGT